MNPTPEPHPMKDRPTAYFWSGDDIRSRGVSDLVFFTCVDVPAPPLRLVADWQREISQRLCLAPGDVAQLPLARARMRWPDYARCVQATSEWTRSLGLHEVLATSDVALMACRGAKYHFDAAHYGGMAFCNIFLSEDRGLDLHFAATGLRIPLTRGTVVVFDTGQPHAVIARHSNGFDGADFPDEQDFNQIFLTWALPLDNTELGQLLGIGFDTDPSTAHLLDEEQLWVNGARASVCPATGRWREAD